MGAVDTAMATDRGSKPFQGRQSMGVDCLQEMSTLAFSPRYLEPADCSLTETAPTKIS